MAEEEKGFLVELVELAAKHGFMVTRETLSKASGRSLTDVLQEIGSRGDLTRDETKRLLYEVLPVLSLEFVQASPLVLQEALFGQTFDTKT